MDNVKKIKDLTTVSVNINDAFERFKRWAKDPKQYDKTGFGFNLDNRFSACEGLSLRVDSWMGSYGSSGCYSVLSVDKQIFNSHLLKVLNGDFEGIMRKVAQSIQHEASTLKEKALKELTEKSEEISTL